MNTPEAVKPKKKKKKPITLPWKPEPNTKAERKTEDNRPSVEQANKLLNLAFIDEAPFMHLAKKKAEVFAISMRDIKYQLNKTMKPLINPKTIVHAEYHDFTNVFSKDVSNTLRPYGKYNHKIKLLKSKDLVSDLRHSAL